MKQIQWTRDKLASFKTVYNRAVTAGENDFFFEDDEFHTPYAKYLIEYLDTVFAPKETPLLPTVAPYMTTTTTETFE